MGRVLIDDDDLSEVIDYLIMTGDGEAEYLAEKLWNSCRDRFVAETFEEYAMDCVKERKDAVSHE